MMESIEDAENMGLPIRRRVEYYAVLPNGVHVILPESWRLEYGRQWCKMPKTQQTKG